MIAAGQGNQEAVELLLKLGADKGLKDAAGKMPKLRRRVLSRSAVRSTKGTSSWASDCPGGSHADHETWAILRG